MEERKKAILRLTERIADTYKVPTSIAQKALISSIIEEELQNQAFDLGAVSRSGEVRNDIDCPKCGEHHVDEGEWAKRLHRKHQCQSCGHIWQPHEHYTFGT